MAFTRTLLSLVKACTIVRAENVDLKTCGISLVVTILLRITAEIKTNYNNKFGHTCKRTFSVEISSLLVLSEYIAFLTRSTDFW